MADFYPVLAKAVAGLANQSAEARRAIYDRARQVLVAQLRSIDPPISETDITRQRLALDDVIARIERDYAPVEAEAARAQLPSEPALRSPERSPPHRPSFASLLPEETASARRADDAAPAAAEAEPDSSALAEPAVQPDRPRLDIAGPAPRRQLPLRQLIVAGGVALGVGAIAVTAHYVNRDNLTVAPPVAQGPASPQPAPSGPKINERVGAEPSAPAPAQQPIAPTGPAAPVQPSRGELAVAQRAVLYMEPADQTQPPRAINGRVTWRVEAQNAGQGLPLETVIRADVDMAEVGLSLVFTIRRNADPAFPASHIVGMRFQRASDDGNGSVREAGVPQFKTEENERGAPLSAITTSLGENLFVSALSRVGIEVERNVELIRTRNWIDIPVRFASGKRGIVAFEKGLSGDQRIAEGFAAWR
jgi:hypothetical protein